MFKRRGKEQILKAILEKVKHRSGNMSGSMLCSSECLHPLVRTSPIWICDILLHKLEILTFVGLLSLRFLAF